MYQKNFYQSLLIPYLMEKEAAHHRKCSCSSLPLPYSCSLNIKKSLSPKLHYYLRNFAHFQHMLDIVIYIIGKQHKY